MRLRFGEFVFDSDTREVVRGGQPLAISPKTFALLDLLLECRPNAVSRAAIRSRLWPDVHVSEANLANLVVELRSALGDDARRPRVIRTVPRFGYSFRAAARPARAAPEGERDPRGPAYRLTWGRREVALEPGDNLIGRDRDAVVWIDDESVSRRHAMVAIGPEGAAIRDLGSKNGTYVGSRKVRGTVPLADREVVRIGPATLTLRILRRTGSTRSTRGKASR